MLRKKKTRSAVCTPLIVRYTVIRRRASRDKGKSSLQLTCCINYYAIKCQKKYMIFSRSYDDASYGSDILYIALSCVVVPRRFSLCDFPEASLIRREIPYTGFITDICRVASRGENRQYLCAGTSYIVEKTIDTPGNPV